MSSDARALPLRGAPGGGPKASGAGRLPGRLSSALARASRAQLLTALCLAAIVALSLLVVLASADRPSLLSPTTRFDFFPGWMAGPLGGVWTGLTRDSTSLRWLFSAAVAAMFVAYLVLLANGPALSARLVIGTLVLVHGIFLLAPPMALTDVFNYINYGRMEVVHNLNPYTTIPILEPHNDPSYALSNWHQLLSPYGPLFTLLTFIVVPLGVAASFWALKAILAASSLALLALVWRCARLLGRDPVHAIAFVGLNPIVLVWGLGGDHNDSLMVLLIVLGFYLLVRMREGEAAAPRVRVLGVLAPTGVGAGAAFVAAAGIKASAAVLIPVVLAGIARSRTRLASVLCGMLLAGAAVAVASVLAFGLHVPDLSTQSRLVTAESVPNLIGLAIGAGGETDTLRVVLTIILAAALLACCVYAWREQEPLSAAGWASAVLVISLSWVLPWYVLWILPLAALSRSRRLRAACAVIGAYLILSWWPASILVWGGLGFHPEKTSLGRLHQRYVRELLN